MFRMTPGEYLSRFWSIPVHFDDECIEVRLRKYRRTLDDSAKSEFNSKVRRYLRKKGEIVSRITTVDGQTVEVVTDHKNDLRQHAVDAFYGKGSPEDIQLTLHLALTAGVTTRSLVGDYCNRNLGIDCNGFVGNYIWHVFRGNPWVSGDANGDNAIGASTEIDKIVREPFATLDDVSRKPQQIFLIGWIDRRGRVIPRIGPRGTAHIAITEPFTLTHKVEAGKPLRPDSIGVLESTGGLGLSASRYRFLDFDPKTKVFRLFRGNKETEPSVKLCALV